MIFPTQPDDIPRDTSLGLLGYRCSRHIQALAEHDHGLYPLTDPEVAEHAIAVLAYGEDLTERVGSVRWPIAAGALTAGAGLERTAGAMDLDVFDLRVGLGHWVAEQHRLGLIDADRYDQVVSLIREESAR